MEMSEFATAEAHNAGAVVPIRHPITNELTDLKIEVRGRDSIAFRKAKKNADRSILRSLTEENPDEDLAEKLEVEIIASCTIGWEGVVVDGEEFLFSHENAIKFYTEAPAVREQVDRFLSRRVNFIKG